SPGVFDETAIAHYRSMLEDAHAKGLTLIVTLQHFVLPMWIHNLDNLNDAPGWAGGADDAPGDAPIVAAFERFAARVAQEYGDIVDYWVTINEPLVYLSAAYLGGVFPPGQLLKAQTTVRAATHMAYAHARARTAIREHDIWDATGDSHAALVSIA